MSATRVTFRLGHRAEEILGVDQERYPGVEFKAQSIITTMPIETARRLLDDARSRAYSGGFDNDPAERACMRRLAAHLNERINEAR